MSNVVALPPREPKPVDGLPPPHDLDAEAAVLSAVFMQGEQISAFVDFLMPEHFYSEAHRWIYTAMVEHHHAQRPIDTTTVGTWLKNEDRLKSVGGMAYITEILPAAPFVGHARTYAVSVYDLWRARQAIASMQVAEAKGYLGVGDIQDWLDVTARRLNDIALRSVGRRVETNQETLRRMVQEILDSRRKDQPNHKITGIATGLHTLDQLTHGLHAGQKTTIVALPRIGKTAFAKQIAVNVAKQGIGVLMFVTEQDREEILNRIHAAEAHVHAGRLKVGELTSEEWTRVFDAMPTVEQLPLHIVAAPALNINELRATTMNYIERAKLDGVPIGLIIMDYAQRLDPAPGFDPKNKVAYIGNTTKKFKQLLQELKIPGIELAQQRRLQKDKNSGLMPKPGMGDTADCSEIEKEADNVFFLYRNPVRGIGSGKIVGESKDRISLVVAKHRGGEEAELQLKYIGEQYRFECLDDDATPPEERPLARAPNVPQPPKDFFNRFNEPGEET